MASGGPEKVVASVGPEKVVTPLSTKKQRMTAEKADRLGVCLLGKRVSRSVVPVCSGGLVWKRIPVVGETLVIITSGDINQSELKDYIVYFQKWKSTNTSSDPKPKTYELPKIWRSQKVVEVSEGLTIIPIDENKLGKGSTVSFIRRCGNCGLRTYRPFWEKEVKTETFPNSICQIVDGDSGGFVVKTYDLEYVNGGYVLKLRGRETVYKTRAELESSISVHPLGAVILTPQSPFMALGVLTFDEDGKIKPVALCNLSVRGTSGGRCMGLQAKDDETLAKIPTEGTSGADASQEGMQAKASAVYRENRKDKIPTEGTSGADASQNEMKAGTSTVDSNNRGDKIPINAQSGACGTAAGDKSLPVVTGICPRKDTKYATTTLDSTIHDGKSSPTHKASSHNGDRSSGATAVETDEKIELKIPPCPGDYNVSLLPDKDTRNWSEAGRIKVALPSNKEKSQEKSANEMKDKFPVEESEQSSEVQETSWFSAKPCYVGALPCKPAYFYGRDKQLEEIVEVLRGTNGKCLVHITGLPGYGKSCLAQSIGHVMAEKGFQVIFLCLREIRCVSKMCAKILVRLKANMCHGLARKQRKLALKLLSETSKTVLILDNAEDILNQPEEREEFYSFVNHVTKFASDVKCVITSRVLCPAPSQIKHHPVKLLELSNEDAANLLQAKVQGAMLTLNDDEAKVIADLCLNIPLILHAAAAYMENVGGPEILIQKLRGCSTAVDLATMHQLSPELRMQCFLLDCLQQLGHELEKALVSLAVFPAAFHAEQVFIVLGLKQSDFPTQTETILFPLVRQSLVHRDVVSNQYFVHRVIQVFYQDKAQKDERLRVCYDQARERFVYHYLSLITDLHQRFLCKDELKEAICGYWHEEQHIIQAILWATESGDAKTVASCAQVLNDAVVFLAKVMRKDVFEAVYKKVLHANKGDARLLADCLTCVGIKLISSCECHRTCSVVSEESYRVLKKAMEMYEQLGVTEGELVAQCYSKLARCVARNGDPTTALKLSGKALEISKKARDEEPFKYASCCNDKAVVLSALNSHEEALSLREDALSVYVEQLDDHPFTGTLYNYLGNDSLALGKFDKAVEYFCVALRIRKSFLGDCHQETARTLHDLGVAYKMKGEFKNAMNQLDEAVKVQEALFDVPHEKLKSLQQALQICVQLNAPEDIKGLQQRIQECETQIAREKKSNNVRLEEIMDIVNNSSMT